MYEHNVNNVNKAINEFLHKQKEPSLQNCCVPQRAFQVQGLFGKVLQRKGWRFDIANQIGTFDLILDCFII